VEIVQERFDERKRQKRLAQQKAERMVYCSCALELSMTKSRQVVKELSPISSPAISPRALNTSVPFTLKMTPADGRYTSVCMLPCVCCARQLTVARIEAHS
jgi:hypothetical protein